MYTKNFNKIIESVPRSKAKGHDSVYYMKENINTLECKISCLKRHMHINIK